MRRDLKVPTVCVIFVLGCGNGETTSPGSAAVDASTDVTSDSGSDASDASGGSGGNTDAGVDGPLDGPAADAPDVAPETGNDGTVDSAEDAADSPDGGGTFLLPPVASCAPQGDACAPTAATPGVFATFRKDFYLPSYAEPTPVPEHGGRFHIASVSLVSGEVTGVFIDGQDVSTMLVEPLMEWYHVWPTTVTAGEPVWFAFHSRNPAWDSAASGQIRIETTGGNAVDSAFPVARTKVPLTYVTTSDDRSSLLIHAHNVDTGSHQLTSLLVNGRDVLGSDVACIADPEIPAGGSVLWEVPLCTPAEPGAPWTVVARYQNTADAVGVGRILKPHFVVEAWSKGSDCAFPGVPGGSFDAHRAAGFDTQYMYFGGNDCGFDPGQMTNVTAPATDDLFLLIGDDFLHLPNPASAITDTSATVGFLTGDESDGSIYENGSPRPAAKADDARRLWSMYPELTVYNGAKTNKNVGSFAGMTDVQGIDFYVAACAPHITQWGNHPPLRGAYDYLLNTRNNHMPLPTWQYAQGLHSGWNRDILGMNISVQPDPQEIWIQAMSVVAAGGKGIMWFQTDQSEASGHPARWDAIAKSNWSIRGVRRLLREGDLTGAASADDHTIVDAIRSRDAIVVPVINLRASSTPTDLACAAVATEAMVPHWVLENASPVVQVDVPPDFGVADVFEVANAQVIDPSSSFSIQGRSVVFDGLPLSNAVPVRLIVLAANTDLRQEVASEMTP